MKKKTGKLIVFEGIDGSGKGTQASLLAERLKREGYQVESLTFPQYGKKTAGLVEEYLAGTFGTAKEVGPYRASIFYAADRYDASRQLRAWLAEGKLVVTDRYMGSNIGHQGGKIRSTKERAKFFEWLHDLEYNVFGIPKPDAQFLMSVNPTIASALRDSRKRAKDIHEADERHLRDAHNAYTAAAKQFAGHFTVVKCDSRGAMRKPDDIHEEVWGHVRKLI